MYGPVQFGENDYLGTVNMVPLKWALRLVWFVCVFLTMPANASSTLIIEETPVEIDLTPYLHILEDVDAQYGEGDLSDTIFNARFEPLYRGAANYGFSKSDWWVRFIVRNDSDSPEKTVFKLDYPLLDFVDVWVLSEGQKVDFWQTGNRRPFSTRAIKHRDFLFPVNLEAHEQQAVYIRIRTEGPVNIGVKLMGDHTLLPKVELEYMVFGAYFGGFLLLALCISLLYLVGREAAFLYYLAYILSYGCYMMAFNGLAFQYLWPDTPEFGQISRPILLTLSTIFLLQFSRSLLGIYKISQFLHKSVSGVQGVLVLILLSVPFFGYGPIVEPLAILDMIALFLVLAMGAVAHNRGDRAARYYLAAWSVFLIGVMLYLLKAFGLLPHNFITHYGFQIGSFFEFIFLSIALGVRVKALRHQSHIDELTLLPNRRHFDEALATEFAHSNDRTETELSLLVIDVDHFKNFNDEQGHVAGDMLLKELGKLFKKQVRRPGVSYRYGGEEFAVLLPRTGIEEARILAERLRECVRTDLSFKDVTISIGVASLKGQSFASAVDFFYAGDQALYKAKHDGRNRVVVYQVIKGDDPTAKGETEGAPA